MYVKRCRIVGSENVESWIAMQLKELNTQGYEVILVSSGAVGLGRQRLKYRKLINSRYLLLTLLRKKFKDIFER